jgi:hypothetical protein
MSTKHGTEYTSFSLVRHGVVNLRLQMWCSVERKSEMTSVTVQLDT